MNLNNVPLILLVALCWMSVGTFAQTNTTSNVTVTPAPNVTMTPASNVTMTPASNVTMTPASNVTMTPASNVTMSPAPNVTMTPAPNVTMTPAPNVTMTPAPNVTMTPANNATTAMPSGNSTTMGSSNSTSMPPSNSTMASTTMGGNNATTAPATTSNTNSSGNATTVMTNLTTATNSSSTAAPATTANANATTATATTTAPPIVTNTTVTTLQSNISRTGCGSLKLCASEPADCDPSTSSCPFVSVRQISGQNMGFQLAGTTSGYVCAALQPATGGNETAYICSKNGTNVTFKCATLANGQFIDNPVCPVNNVQAKVTGDIVQCSFDVTVPNATARSTDTTFKVSVLTGPVNSTTGALGSPTRQVQTAAVDLTVATSDTNNTINANSTTAAPTVSTTAGAVTLQQCISRALLIILGIVSLGWL